MPDVHKQTSEAMISFQLLIFIHLRTGVIKEVFFRQIECPCSVKHQFEATLIANMGDWEGWIDRSPSRKNLKCCVHVSLLKHPPGASVLAPPNNI